MNRGKWLAFCGHFLLLRGTIKKLGHGGYRDRKVVLVKILGFEKVVADADLTGAGLLQLVCTRGCEPGY